MMKNRKLFMLALIPACLIVALVTSLVVYNGHSLAFSKDYFDPGDATTSVKLRAGESQNVRNAEVFVGLYFTKPTGNSVIIGNANYCIGNAYDDFAETVGGYNAIPNGRAVTTYRVTGSAVHYGYKGVNCNAPLVIPLGALPLDPDTGRYKANFSAVNTGPAPPFVVGNYFALSSSGGAPIIAQQGGVSGYQVTMRAFGNSPAYSNMTYRFGTDCSVKSQVKGSLYYYDLDNNSSAPQSGPPFIQMQLRQIDKAGVSTYWNTVTGNWQAALSRWTPVNGNSVIGHTDNIKFNPGDKYIWTLINVANNNTIQVSTPYDGIHYDIPCPVAQPVNWKLVGNTVATNTVTGSSGASITALPTQKVDFTSTIKNIGANATDKPWFWGTYSSTGMFIPLPPEKQIAGGPAAPLGAGASVNYGPTSFTPTNADIGSMYCVYTGYDPADSAGARNGRGSLGCVTVVAPPPVLSCGGATVSPSAIDPTTGFTVQASAIRSSGSFPATARMTISISGPGYNYSSGPQAVSGVGTTASLNVSAGPTGASGTFNVTWTMSSSDTNPISVGCGPVSFIVMNQPYLSVNGGDVAVGASPDSSGSCVSTANAGIESWNKGDAAYNGAGTQYAAFALGQILGFASKQYGAPPGAPIGLSFANTSVDIPNSVYGGNFGNAQFSTCDMTNGEVPTGTTQSDIPNTVNGPTPVIVHISGNVYIDHNVVYGGSPWANVAAIPYFKLVVTGGNIYISNNVTELDGLYVAEPTGAGTGIIYTCATGSGTPVDPKTDATYLTDCGNQLVINGSFIAKQVQFLRTFSTLGKANDQASSNANSAEVFNYSPEMWLPRVSGPPSDKYNAIIGLPPVL